MQRTCICLLALALISLPALADGPETGIVEGTIDDGQGTGLPGVLLTLTGDRGSTNVVSETGGAYRFALLVPGPYVIKADLEGFQTAEAAVAVTAGGKHTIDLSMRLGTAEEITVTSEAPMVDKFNVTAGTVLSAEIGVQTAGTTRTYYGIINALPGVHADANNDDIQQTRPSVNGTHFADNAVYIDGVDTTFAKFGGSRVYLPVTAITEVSMEAGGSGAEYGRVIGSSTNVIVKSGTNRWHSDVLFQRQEVKWGSEYKDHPELSVREPDLSIVDRDGSVLSKYPSNWFKRTDGEKEGGSNGWEFSTGGPIKRDKAWFFVGLSSFDDAFTERLLGGDPYDVSLINKARIFKVNFQPAPAHSLSASFIDTPAFRNYFNQQSFDYWTPTPHGNESDLSTVNWNSSISSKVFLESKVAIQVTNEDKYLGCNSIIIEECIDLKSQDRGPLAGHSATNTSGGDTSLPLRFPRDESLGRWYPGNNYDVYRDSNNLGAWHNGWILSDGFGFNEFPRDQANVGLTQFIGANHEVKWGLDYQNTKWEGEAARTSVTNGYNWDPLNPFGWENAGVGMNWGFLFGIQLPEDSCSLTRTSATSPTNPSVFGGTTRGRSCYWVDQNAPELLAIKGTGDAEMEDTGLYVRDRFTVGDHLTFNIGIRAEVQKGWNDVRREVINDKYADPRFNVTYDPKGDGRLLFSLNAGRYHAMLNQAWISGGGGGAGGMHDMWNGYEGHVVWLFCDPWEAQVFCNESNGFDRGAVGESGYNYRWETIIPGKMWNAVDAGIFDHNIDTYNKDEVILGMEWQFTRNWALDVKYIDWELNDQMFSQTQIDQNGDNIFLTGNFSNLPSIVKALADAREANGLERAIDDDLVDKFTGARNSYEGLQIQLNKRLSNGYALYNNISFSETDTTGAGAWWNNTTSSYGENMEVVLTANHIAQCNGNQDGRTVPVDCSAALNPHIGQIASTINRRGPNHSADREIIFNSFGFKIWNLGVHQLTLGGHLSFQSGTPWGRSEGASAINFNPLETRGTPNGGVGMLLAPNGTPFTTACPAGIVCEGAVGVEYSGRTMDEHTLNMSGAWGFPLGGQRVRGELRIEALNVTDQQKQRDYDGRGEVYPVRRYYQRPRQIRANFKISF